MSKTDGRKKRRGGCLAVLLGVIMVIALAAAGVYIAARKVPVSIAPADNADEVNVNEDLSGEWVNILLLGADSDQYGRTDTMIIASVHSGTGEVKLTSLMRDMYVPIEGHGKNKLNAASHFGTMDANGDVQGGITLTLKTINQNFDMNLSKYAMVDFSAFAYIVDKIGGIDVPVTEAEMRSMNQLMQDMRVLYPDIDLPKNDLIECGDSVHLDGMQALAFVRIRKLDSDYNRTNRQRMALKAVLDKAIAVHDPNKLFDIYKLVMDRITTNLTTDEIWKLGVKVVTNGAGFSEMRIPADGTYTSETINGMSCLVPDLEKNKALLHTFIYGEDAAQTD